MGAGHSKHSKHGRSQRDRYGQRRVNMRPPLPVIVIVPDDTKTAPAYFEALAREVKQHVTLRIDRGRCNQTGPQAVVDRAIVELKSLGKNQHEKEDAVWVLMDLEGDQNQQSIVLKQAQRAEREKIMVALSRPCFEIWTLLHLKDTGENFGNCSAVFTRLKNRWNEEFNTNIGPKGQADYSKIICRRIDAAKRARDRHTKTPQDPSWTEIYKVIEYIDELAGKQA